MKFWLSHIRNLETFIDDPARLLDRWQRGGADGLVLGPLLFGSVERLAHSRGRGEFRPAVNSRTLFDPDPSIYTEFGSPVPPSPAGDTDLRKRLHGALRQVVDRGWELWLYDPFTGASGPDLNDNAARITGADSKRALAARMLDTIVAFPEATGFIIDGPAWGFEIADLDVAGLEQRRRLLELPTSRTDCTELGYELDRLTAAHDELDRRLHALSPRQIQDYADDPDGLFGGEEFRYWRQFRSTALTAFYRTMRQAIDQHVPRGAQLAVCPRTPALASLAGYDYAANADVADVVMPKLYYWQRGYDGLIGTAWRWANTLTRWNPSLSVRDACAATRLMFGDSMPVVDALIDFDRLLEPAFLHALATQEIGRAQAAIGDRARMVPWVDSGRAPHDGDPLPAAQLGSILQATKTAGVERFTYFNSTKMSPAEWTMLSHHCGVEWNPYDSPDWFPPDQPTL